MFILYDYVLALSIPKPTFHLKYVKILPSDTRPELIDYAG